MIDAIDQLIEDIENGTWATQEELKAVRKDADCVHSDGFYFFNMNIHRTMTLLEFSVETRKMKTMDVFK